MAKWQFGNKQSIALKLKRNLSYSECIVVEVLNTRVVKILITPSGVQTLDAGIFKG